MKPRPTLIRFLFAGLAFASVPIDTLTAQIRVEETTNPQSPGPNQFWVPYVFYSETFDIGVGVAGFVTRLWQEQLKLYATAFHTKNGSSRIWMGAYDIRLNPNGRLFMSPDIFYTDYSNLKAYVNGNEEFPFERAGTNDSSPENFVTGKAEDVAFKVRFRYVLPFGDGRDNIINRYRTTNGFLVPNEPKETTKPTGRSYLFVEPFYRDQYIQFDGGKRSLRSNGIRAEIRHDRTDYVLNPSKGSLLKLIIGRDFGWGKSDGAWTNWEIDYSHYISLGETAHFRQQVLAFNFWLSDTPTFKTEIDDTGEVFTSNRPPYYDATSLGGLDRMRAFNDSRFNDRSAIYYGIEYRLTPNWNPFSKLGFAGIPDVDWWQWIVFAEAGRVASKFDLGTLHTDMKTDIGFGFRLFSEGALGRLDFAFSDESWGLRAMIGHPF